MARKENMDLEEPDVYDDLDIDTSDYGFIVSADGELPGEVRPARPTRPVS